MSLYDSFAARPGGGRALAKARLQRTVLRILDKALNLSEVDSQTALAKKLRVRKSAVNQVFRGDGNVRISTLAEYLYELGFEVDLELLEAGELHRAVLEGRPAIPLQTELDLTVTVVVGVGVGAVDWRSAATSQSTSTLAKRDSDIKLSFSGSTVLAASVLSDFTAVVGA